MATQRDYRRLESVPEKYISAVTNIPIEEIRPFARRLKLEDHEIEDLEVYCKDKGPKEFKYQIVRRWLQRCGGHEASDRRFATALEEVGQDEAARMILQESPPTQETGYWSYVTDKDSKCSNVHPLQTEDEMSVKETLGSREPREPKDQVMQKDKPPSELRKPSSVFTGKEHDKCLQGLAHNYHEYRRSGRNETGVHIEVLCGIGGCGKTEILSSFVWKNWKNYKGVFVLSGTSNSLLDFGFKKMLEKLDMDLSDEEKSPSSIRVCVLDKLSKMREWLLVIDDVDDPRLIQQALPVSTPLRDGHILITSRVGEDWDDWYMPIMVNHVLPLTPKDSALYLIREVHTVLPLEKAEAMLNEFESLRKDEYEALLWLGSEEGLHGLPLALKQAGKYISENRFTYSAYKELYRKCNLDMLKPMGSDPIVGWLKLHKINADLAPTLRICIDKYAHQIKELKIEDLLDRDIDIPDEQISKVKAAIRDTRPQVFIDHADRGRLNILKTWKLNYETISKEDHTREFLHLCSCLATRIQVALFVDGANYLYPGHLRDFIIPKKGSKSSKHEKLKKITDLFTRIKHFSFATNVVGKSEEEEHRRSLGRMGEYTVHRLLQFVVFMRFISPVERIQCINNTLNILEKLFPKMEEIQDGSAGGVRDRHSIIAFHTLALAEQIKPAIKENGISGVNDVNPLFVAVSTYLFRLGRARDAKVLCKVMVLLGRSRKPVNKIKLADELCHLGEAYFQIGEEKLGKAEELLGDSFALLKEIKGENDIDVLTAKQRHARILQNMKTYLMDDEKRVEVKVMLEDILEKMKILFETPEEQQNLNIANAMHQLGRFYQDTSDYDKAQQLLEKSLEVRQTYWKRKFGTADVESVAYGLTNLARNYIISSSEDTKKTEELLKEALKIKEKRLAPTNESYQLGKYYLAAYYRIQGQNDLSEKTAKDIVTDTYRKKLESLLQKGSNTSDKVDLKDVFPPEKIDI